MFAGHVIRKRTHGIEICTDQTRGRDNAGGEHPFCRGSNANLSANRPDGWRTDAGAMAVCHRSGLLAVSANVGRTGQSDAYPRLGGAAAGRAYYALSRFSGLDAP